ncbi:MAG: hypothetical protein KKA62_05570 [Nanoarchaeota archaeon]|nr:hypothetical protein [Nanoarchaeota archaeon]MBU1643955.1 hypothetical protein [Nanoarchaeota archaeon]MBU1977392.1 hypothetical protein [Nanoarchaeota archaeon]
MGLTVKKAKKIFLLSSAISLTPLGHYYILRPFSEDFLINKRDPDVQEYIEENLEQIIQAQEEKLGISYPTFPKNFNYILPSNNNLNILGLYDHKTNTFFFQSGILTTPGFNFGDFFASIATFGKTEEAKRIVDHELAHYYCDNLSESLERGSWPDYRYKDQITIFTLKIISEGTAMYFENTLNGGEDDFNDSEWPTEFNGFFSGVYSLNNRIIYQGGYHLVKPIIDKFGQKGIEYLMFNPPRYLELIKLPKYQERIMKELSEKVAQEKEE